MESNSLMEGADVNHVETGTDFQHQESCADQTQEPRLSKRELKRRAKAEKWQQNKMERRCNFSFFIYCSKINMKFLADKRKRRKEKNAGWKSCLVSVKQLLGRN